MKMDNLETIKKHWEVGNLTSGQIAWLIEQAEKAEQVEFFLNTITATHQEKIKFIRNVFR
jgi:predicted RNA-binding protein with EMAP domain